ncbi:putative transposase [Rhodococcus rhodochrous J45]|uniref:Putative transposase n=1 Tax=Rhodococcus rhodochrous J45 TaxID=935266 RepID=A0A562D6X6_RHORH|nr:IS3 family transposase [Rhodococcus rhodochrous]TWH05486.1 putative transposase [Rhodococcus rhodochrous J45]
MEFIGAHQGNRVGADGLVWGVDSMCSVLTEHGLRIAPSTYYEHVNRGPSSRMLRDAQVIDAIYTLRQQQPLYRVLGARKMWIVLHSNGYGVARCTVERLMGQMGWRGATKKKCPRTTVGSPSNPRAADLVDRRFWAAAPNRLWVADFTYCRTETGWVYTAFVIDVFARKIVGWKVAAEMTANLVATAIDNAVESRKRFGAIDFTNLVHHSDAGSQGGFNRSSQHLDDGGVRWDAATSRHARRR